MSSRRKSIVLTVCAASVLALVGEVSAAQRQRRQADPGQTVTRTIGVAATVTGTQNALMGAATLTDTITGGALRPRRATVDPARAASQKRRMNAFIRERVGALQKLESYRKLKGN
jgi:hypothetical protein